MIVLPNLGFFKMLLCKCKLGNQIICRLLIFLYINLDFKLHFHNFFQSLGLMKTNTNKIKR